MQIGDGGADRISLAEVIDRPGKFQAGIDQPLIMGEEDHRPFEENDAGGIPVERFRIVGHRHVGFAHPDGAGADADLEELRRSGADPLSAKGRKDLRPEQLGKQ